MPPPPPSAEGMKSTSGVESLDPKLTVMGGGAKEQAADYANCKDEDQSNQNQILLYRSTKYLV